MNQQGQIVTFYSYKGGVGRTMALANVAILLGGWGYKTLIVDWDLEAPGLEHFFKEYILDFELTRNKEGIVDILSSVFNRTSAKEPHLNWKELLVNFLPPKSKTSIYLLTAGKRGDDYFKKVRDFDVESFYFDKQGGEFIESLRKEWKQSYDFILVDSRTGVTDIGGICTIQLPDILVSLFTATEQSLQGIKNVIKTAQEGRQDLPVDRLNLPSIPIPSRIETGSEFELAQEWLSIFSEGLTEIFSDWLPQDVKVKEFLEVTKLPYAPYFSFGEKLAVIKQGVSDPTGLGYAYETLAAIIANDLESVDRVLSNRSEFIQDAALRPDIRSITKVSDSQKQYSPEVADQLYDRAQDLQKEDSNDEALEFIRKAVEIWQEFLDTDFVNIGPKLARARRFLSDYFNREKDLFNAIAEANASIDIYRKLHQITISDFEEELGGELLNLSNILIVTNQYMEALTASEEALAIYRRLREVNKAKYEPDLASSLNIVSECLYNLDKIKRALIAGKESADIFKRLALKNPTRFNNELASSLNSLLDQIALLNVDEYPEILLLTRNAIQDFRELAIKEPKRFESDFAKNLNVLTDLLLHKEKISNDEVLEAMTLQMESINILRQLVRSNPLLAEPELARNLTNLAKLQLKNQKYSEARETAEEAVEILNQLNRSRYKDEIKEATELIADLDGIIHQLID